MTDGRSGVDSEPTVAPAEPTPVPVDADASGGPQAEEQPVQVRGLERRRSVFASPWLAWGVAVLAIAAAVFAGLQWADLYAAEQTRDEVAADGRRLALLLTTFEGENIEDWYADIRNTATGEYATQLQDVFNQETRDTLREIEVVSRGEVSNLFVQDIDGDEAKVFALVKQTYANNTLSDPRQDELRMDITLQRVDDRWLGSSVAVLGPEGVVAPTGDQQESAPNAEEEQ
jgi:Mce-associated membrane protein